MGPMKQLQNMFAKTRVRKNHFILCLAILPWLHKYVEGCCNDCDADRSPSHALLRFLVEEGSPRSHVSIKISSYEIVCSGFCSVLGRMGKKTILAFCFPSVFISDFFVACHLFLYLGLRSFNFWRWHGMPFPTSPMPGKTTGVYYPLLINWGNSIEIREADLIHLPWCYEIDQLITLFQRCCP